MKKTTERKGYAPSAKWRTDVVQRSHHCCAGTNSDERECRDEKTDNSDFYLVNGITYGVDYRNMTEDDARDQGSMIRDAELQDSERNNDLEFASASFDELLHGGDREGADEENITAARRGSRSRTDSSVSVN